MINALPAITANAFNASGPAIEIAKIMPAIIYPPDFLTTKRHRERRMNG